MADCEAIHSGLLDQPSNAVSSLAYVAAGLAVWRQNHWQGGALVIAGAGSVAYHGFGGDVAHELHDVGIAALLAVLIVSAPAMLRARRTPLMAAALVATAAAIPLQLLGRTGGPLCAPHSVLQAHAGWHVIGACALALAFRATHAPALART